MSSELQRIYDETLELDTQDRARYGTILQLFLDVFLEEMKKTPVFNNLFHEVYFGGSFFDGLKLASTDPEFDLNIVMDVKSGITVEGLSNPGSKKPNFGFLKVSPDLRFGESKLEKSLTFMKGNETFLSPAALFDVVSTTADRAVSNLKGVVEIHGKIFTIRKHYIGAPHTLMLERPEDNIKCEIDFVPSLILGISQLPREVQENVNKVKKICGSKVDTCMAIGLKPADKEQFEIDFHDIERDILKVQDNAKKVVMLLKHLRDIKGGNVAKLWSHSLKTVVMNKILNGPCETDLEKFLISCLRSLYKGLKEGFIPDAFFPNCNLMNRIGKHSTAIASTKGFIGNELNKIDGKSGYKWQQTDWQKVFLVCVCPSSRSNMSESSLQKFAESMGPPADYVDCSKSVANELFRLLQAKSKTGLDRCRIVGGLAKKTSTHIKVDTDLVIFVNVAPGNILDTKDKVLDDWLDILLMNTELQEKNIKKSPYSLQFLYKKIEIDLLVAINFNADPTIQQKLAMNHIRTSSDPRKTSEQMSSELTELALSFMKDKSKFCHDLARLAKFWSQTIFYPQYVSGKSTMMEMMAVKVAMEEENRQPCHPNYQMAFKSFLKMIVNISSIRLVFNDFYQKSDIPKHILSQVPLILDPSNPYNNLLSWVSRSDGNNNVQKGPQFITLFPECAKNTLRILATEPSQFGDLFLPQPMMWRTPVAKKVIIKNELCGYEDYHDTMPRLVSRATVPPHVQHMTDNLLRVYTCAIKTAEADKPSSSLRELQENMVETVNKMKNVSKTWTPTSARHEDNAVTLMMPLTGVNQGKAVCLSFNFDVEL